MGRHPNFQTYEAEEEAEPMVGEGAIVVEFDDFEDVESGQEAEDLDDPDDDSAPEGGPQCITVELFRIKNWPEFKVGTKKHCKKIWGKTICTNVPQAYQRNCELKAFAKICHPKAETVKQLIIKTTREAVVAGAVVGAYTGNLAAATAALKTYLQARLATKLAPIAKLTVKVDTDTKCGDWKPR